MLILASISTGAVYSDAGMYYPSSERTNIKSVYGPPCINLLNKFGWDQLPRDFSNNGTFP